MILAAFLATALSPTTVATVPKEHVLVEGVATDEHSIFVSSVLDRTILVCRRAECRTLTRLPVGLHPLGLAWDGKRKRLWVAADCPKLTSIPKCDRGALLALDRKGRLQARIVPSTDQFHPGDISVSGNELFVSDSRSGAVYRLTPDGRLSTVVAPGVGKSGQGSALDGDGSRLIVADYSQGITAVDLSSGARKLLLRDNGRPLRGIDGLVRCGETYLGIYNGEVPGRLVAFKIKGNAIDAREAVEGLTMPDPTQVALTGNQLLIVSDSGWDAASKGLTERSTAAPIVALAVSEICEL